MCSQSLNECMRTRSDGRQEKKKQRRFIELVPTEFYPPTEEMME